MQSTSSSKIGLALVYFSRPSFSTPPHSKFKVFSVPGSESESESLKHSTKHTSKLHLPITIKQSGLNYTYTYNPTPNPNQSKLQLQLQLELVVPPNGNINININMNLYGKIVGMMRGLLIPNKVSWNYREYVKWKLLHRVFSSALQLLATQAMFRAIGVGYANSLPSAAALNWLLKDGLGRLSRFFYTASLASAFDTNLKRVRFSTSLIFTLSIGLELMTPLFPNCFLLLASLANIAKQISLASHLATATAVHQSFALADNLGEVSAKAQIQTVCFDNLGILLAASLNVVCRNNTRLQAGLPFVVYPIFSAIDLCGIYQSLKHVHLQTLTKDRLEIILNTWIECGYVPSPAEVSKLEGINLFEHTDGKKGIWPIRIGCLDAKRQVPLLSMLTVTSLSVDDYYFICLESRSTLRKSRRHGILLSLREDAGIKDIITGLLQACYVRKAIGSSGKTWENIFETFDISHSISRQWFAMIENSKHRAQNDQNRLQEQMVNASWAAKNVLLSTQEQARYEFVEENS